MSKLAINGGPAEAVALKEKIPRWPKATDDDKRALIDVLESGKWCRIGGAGEGFQDSKGELFEKSFSEYHNAKYGIAVANGTVALELALKTFGVGFRDEVLVPAITFIATASAATEVGAVPIFADIDPETGNVSPESLENSITDKTKAVIVVHYSGYPVNFDEILPIVEKNDLFLLEDCAQAHGTEWRGRRVGTIGIMGCFSFQESKSLTAGEGGMVLTNDEELANKARLIHNIGRAVGRQGYEHRILSSNYRMTEFQAALLLSKLKTLPEEVERKYSNGEYLAEKLRKIRGIEPLKKDPRITKIGYCMFVAKYNSEEFNGLPKQKFMDALNAEGVPVHTVYGMPLYKQPAFRKENLRNVLPEGIKTQDYENLYLPNSEEFTAREIAFSHPVLLVEREYLDLIVSSIEKIKENVDELL